MIGDLHLCTSPQYAKVAIQRRCGCEQFGRRSEGLTELPTTQDPLRSEVVPVRCDWPDGQILDGATAWFCCRLDIPPSVLTLSQKGNFDIEMSELLGFIVLGLVCLLVYIRVEHLIFFLCSWYSF